MVEKLNRFLTAALILAVIVISAFWVIQRGRNTGISTAPLTTEKLPPQSENAEELRGPDARGVVEMLEVVFTEEERASPDFQQLMSILKSPAYEEFLESTPTKLGDFLDFFQEQGMPINKSDVFDNFKGQLSTEFSDELEPRMRSQLSALFSNNEVEIGSDAGLRTLQQVIAEFLSDEQNTAWMMAHFQGDYNAFGQWTVDILRNPTPLPTESLPVVEDIDRVSISTRQDFSGADSVPTIELQQDSAQERRVEVPSGEDSELLGGSNEAEFPAQFMLEPLESRELSSEEGIEENLKTAMQDQFSPQRFNRAMQTLNQYGPEEGLRRLKVSDPEVATHVERLIQSKQEEH